MTLKFDYSSSLKFPEDDLKNVEISRSLSGMDLKLYILVFVLLLVLFTKLFNNAPTTILLLISNFLRVLNVVCVPLGEVTSYVPTYEDGTDRVFRNVGI
jgi:hypothetical protein